jgi:hypothetical protein
MTPGDERVATNSANGLALFNISRYEHPSVGRRLPEDFGIWGEHRV